MTIAESLKTRVVAIFMLGLGFYIARMPWVEIAGRERFVRPGAALVGPFLIASALWLLIEAPPLPAQKYTRLGKILTALGAVASLAYAGYVYAVILRG